MKYQLVLQWPQSSFRRFDDFVELEDRLTAAVADHGTVDGHDVGSRQFNIFIATDVPEHLFASLQHMLADLNRLIDVRAAFRELSNSEYTILWPTDLGAFEVA